MGQLDGRIGIVTGAASGIGAACARVLSREGAKLVLTDLDDAGGQRLAEQTGGVYLHHDVTDETGWPAVIAAAERLGGLADPGGQRRHRHHGIGDRHVARRLAAADGGECRRRVPDGEIRHPAMRRSGGGSVVMMSSVAGIRGSANLAGYSATKGAVRLFAKSIALECAGARDNIRVNSVHPGVIDTPIWTKLPPGANAPLDPHRIAEATVPIGTAGQAEDIANGVLFLCSDASSHMTGSELVIDGGMTAGRAGRMG